MPGQRPALVIFDCDGVLVDSEPLAARVLVAALARAGHRLDEATSYQRFLGRSMASIAALIAEDYGWRIGEVELERIRQDLFDLFRRELRPIQGIESALDRLNAPVCVASSGQPDRIRLALDVTGLRARFEPHLFSAAAVANGKPAPDLFLHAAERMDVAPDACLVIEDSPAGVEAAHRAGMRVFAFTGGSHAQRPGHREALEALGPDLVFDEMRTLPDRL